MRVLVDRTERGLRIWSRNENDVTVSFPELHAIVGIGDDFLLDGEVVALGEGVPSFGALADRMHVRDANRARRLAETNPVTLIAFDLLRLDGQDLCAKPLGERRERLVSLGLDDVAWQVPPTYDDGQMLLDAAEAAGSRGDRQQAAVLAVPSGQRSRDWLKFPIRPTGSYVVGGFRHETGSTHRFGAVLVGQPTGGPGVPRPRGQRDRRQGRQLLAGLLTPMIVEESPFTEVLPRLDRVGTVWVSRRWSWTCSTSGSRPTVGCGSRRTVASARTSAPRTWSELT